MPKPDDVRTFTGRDWSAIANDKERYWRAWKLEHGAAGGIRVAETLRAHARKARPDWPSESERREDLETHLRVIEVIRRARPHGH